MLPYKEFEHTADIGMEIYGATVEEVFRNAGRALFDTIVDIDRIQPRVERAVSVAGDDNELLLMNWLRRLLYLFAVDGEVYGEFRIIALQSGELQAIVTGEPLDMERHGFKTELKAITYHKFELIHAQTGWKATVIFDV